MRATVFTVEQREALRDRVVKMAKLDPRIVAGAIVGSLAHGGDRYSDLDLTFGVADGVLIPEVLDDWSRTLARESAALHLIDLERGPTIFRVFLFPDALQLDVSLTPAARFAPAGPKFRLLFGETVKGMDDAHGPPDAADLFGWGVIYAVHVRTCIERGRPWQAEHYLGEVRDHALSLACLRLGLVAVQARGYDDLPPDVLARFEDTRVASVEARRLREALSAATRELLREGKEAKVPVAGEVAKRLAELL
jgi:hypothetical protein